MMRRIPLDRRDSERAGLRVFRLSLIYPYQEKDTFLVCNVFFLHLYFNGKIFYDCTFLIKSVPVIISRAKPIDRM